LFNCASGRLDSMLMKNNAHALPEILSAIVLGVERMHSGLERIESSAQNLEQPLIDTDTKDAPSLGATASSAASTATAAGAEPGEPPPAVPRWAKVQLLPHLAKQLVLLQQVKSQINEVQNSLEERGLGAGLPQMPTTALQLRLSAIEAQQKQRFDLPDGGGLISSSGSDVGAETPRADADGIVPPSPSRWRSQRKASAGAAAAIAAAADAEPQWSLGRVIESMQIESPAEEDGSSPSALSPLCCRSRGAAHGVVDGSPGVPAAPSLDNGGSSAEIW